MIPKNFDSQFAQLVLLRFPASFFLWYKKKTKSSGWGRRQIKFSIPLFLLALLVASSCCFVIIMMMMVGVIVAVFAPPPPITQRQPSSSQPLADSVGVMQICIQLSTFTRHKMKCDNQIRPTTMRSKGKSNSSCHSSTVRASFPVRVPVPAPASAPAPAPTSPLQPLWAR